MSNHKTLAVQRTITTAGNHELIGDATGLISGTVTDVHGKSQSVGLAIVVVSGLRKNCSRSRKPGQKASLPSSR